MTPGRAVGARQRVSGDARGERGHINLTEGTKREGQLGEKPPGDQTGGKGKPGMTGGGKRKTGFWLSRRRILGGFSRGRKRGGTGTGVLGMTRGGSKRGGAYRAKETAKGGGEGRLNARATPDEGLGPGGVGDPGGLFKKGGLRRGGPRQERGPGVGGGKTGDPQLIPKFKNETKVSQKGEKKGRGPGEANHPREKERGRLKEKRGGFSGGAFGFFPGDDDPGTQLAGAGGYGRADPRAEKREKRGPPQTPKKEFFLKFFNLNFF